MKALKIAATALDMFVSLALWLIGLLIFIAAMGLPLMLLLALMKYVFL